MKPAREEVYLCSAKRTAIGSFQGALAEFPVPALGAHVIKAVLETSGADPKTIQEVIMGCVLTAGVGQAPARQALVKAGLPYNVQALTVNKVCSSGLKSVMLASNAIELGHQEAIIAGGMESMSSAPYLMPTLRSGARLGNAVAEDSIVKDGLWDVYNNFHMGSAAELCAKEYAISREAQDAFALESYRRANEAIKNGYFQEEIASLSVTVGKETKPFAIDEEPGKVRPDKVAQLKPVFDKNGTVTAANASSLSDGAAAMLVCSEEYLKKAKLTPLARILSQGWHAQEPEWFTTAPVGAVEVALKRAGLKIADIDLFELNEAFSTVAIACYKKLEIDPTQVNIHGGAVALGHPLGASGARILTTLLYALKRLGKKRGVVGICNGGGEATALVIERV